MQFRLPLPNADKRLRQSASAPHSQPGFDSPCPRQIARKANLVKAPRRKRGERGSKPRPSTILPSNYWGKHKGADDPCKIVARGALPRCSTNFFRSGALGVRARLLTEMRRVRILRPEPIRSARLVAGSPPSHGGETGSKPVRSTGRPIVEWTRRRSTEPEVEVRILVGWPIPG